MSNGSTCNFPYLRHPDLRLVVQPVEPILLRQIPRDPDDEVRRLRRRRRQQQQRGAVQQHRRQHGQRQPGAVGQGTHCGHEDGDVNEAERNLTCLGIGSVKRSVINFVFLLSAYKKMLYVLF